MSKGEDAERTGSSAFVSAKALDDGVANIGERMVRSISRRRMLRNTIIGGATALAAVMIGERPAFASACSANCGPTPRCGGCPANGCPSGYGYCYGSPSGTCFNHEGYRCEWPAGYWIACSGLGLYGKGIEVW